MHFHTQRKLSKSSVHCRNDDSFKRLLALKNSQAGLSDKSGPKFKRRIPKGPNPMSCKKKKKSKPKVTQAPTETQESTAAKKKRKRIKIPKHVKEALFSATTWFSLLIWFVNRKQTKKSRLLGFDYMEKQVDVCHSDYPRSIRTLHVLGVNPFPVPQLESWCVIERKGDGSAASDFSSLSGAPVNGPSHSLIGCSRSTTVGMVNGSAREPETYSRGSLLIAAR